MLLLKMISLSFNCNYLINDVLDCAIICKYIYIYILLIIEPSGDVSPENDPHLSSWYQTTYYNSLRLSI